MRPPGIEPGLEAWEATVIPLDHGRLLLLYCLRSGPIEPEAIGTRPPEA